MVNSPTLFLGCGLQPQAISSTTEEAPAGIQQNAPRIAIGRSYLKIINRIGYRQSVL